VFEVFITKVYNVYLLIKPLILHIEGKIVYRKGVNGIYVIYQKRYLHCSFLMKGQGRISGITSLIEVCVLEALLTNLFYSKVFMSH
jgi:hypothetical protein